ncbi:sensor histidine kinase [Clostridium niameyense]|nr:HAMP domain-containing sensor histidine kinase [Clostridium niameyense]
METRSNINDQEKFVNLLVANKQIYEFLDKNYCALDFLSDVIFIFKNRRIFFLNKAALDVIGETSLDKVKNKYLGELVHMDNETIDLIKHKLKTLYDGGQFTLKECKLVNKNNELIYLSSKFIFLDNYNGEDMLIWIAKDVTSAKVIKDKLYELDKLNKFNKEKTNEISNISHDLRTPLNIILSTIQLIEKIYKDNKGRQYEKFSEYIKIMTQNCYRLTKLINNIIDSSKIDNGFFNLNLKNYNIVEIVENITLSSVPYAQSKNIQIIFDTNIEEKILAFDADKIERVMLNLLSNAIKFTPIGGEIFVKVLDDGDFIIISVKDSGVGIPNTIQKKIFEKFNQGNCSSYRKSQGSGIGLFIVKSFIEAHGGAIKVDSKIDKGSKFTIKLPVKVLECKNEHNIKNKNSNPHINIEFSDIEV